MPSTTNPESLFFKEALRHRQLLQITEQHFRSWAYFPVLTPVFDYYETYRPLLKPAQEKKTYRFTGRDGELLLLRSDITLFLAKQLSLGLDNKALPYRVYYADSILRHQEDHGIADNESFQIGAELIGLPGQDGDLEILLLLHELLSCMELPKKRLHIGSHSLWEAVLTDKIDPVIAEEIMEIRDKKALGDLLKTAALPCPSQRADLLLFMGTIEDFLCGYKALGAACYPGNPPPTDPIDRALGELASLSAELRTVLPQEDFLIDLSEHGGQPYYTGFTVRAYAEGANRAIASGGRYDQLLSFSSTPKPAVGFSMMMKKIEALSTHQEESPPIKIASGKNFIERYHDATRRRAFGEQVALSAKEVGSHG